MAHIRRGFFEAREEAPVRAGWILRQMGDLYQLEEKLRQRKASPRMRKIIRKAEASPILSRIKKALLLFKQSGRHLPRGAFGKALSYALGQWDGLTPYLEDGKIEIDNNPVENSIRPTAVGKKNWLFIGDAGARETAAILYTVIESARRRGIDPKAWLTDLLPRLPSMPQQDLPNFTSAARADPGKKVA